MNVMLLRVKEGPAETTRLVSRTKKTRNSTRVNAGQDILDETAQRGRHTAKETLAMVALAYGPQLVISVSVNMVDMGRLA